MWVGCLGMLEGWCELFPFALLAVFVIVGRGLTWWEWVRRSDFALNIASRGLSKHCLLCSVLRNCIRLRKAHV